VTRTVSHQEPGHAERVPTSECKARPVNESTDTLEDCTTLEAGGVEVFWLCLLGGSSRPRRPARRVRVSWGASRCHRYGGGVAEWRSDGV